MWVEEGEESSRQTRAGLHHCGVDVNFEGACHTVRVGKGSEFSILQEQLNEQQLQIETIITSLSKMKSVLDQAGSRSRNPSYQFTTEGLPICLRCWKPGHVLRQCRQGPKQQTSSMPGVHPDSNPAPASTGPSGMGYVGNANGSNETDSPSFKRLTTPHR